LSERRFHNRTVPSREAEMTAFAAGNDTARTWQDGWVSIYFDLGIGLQEAGEGASSHHHRGRPARLIVCTLPCWMVCSLILDFVICRDLQQWSCCPDVDLVIPCLSMGFCCLERHSERLAPLVYRHPYRWPIGFSVPTPMRRACPKSV
jgi:hypothetical protein